MSSAFSKALDVTASGLRAQAERLRHLSENISNVDTPGYRRKTVSFRSEIDRNTGANIVDVGPVTLDDQALRQVFDPSHPMADETGNFESSNVNLLVELADAREAQRSYEANLKIFEQTRSMSASLMDLLRR